MPSEKNKIIEFNQYMKSDKTLCITYVDIEYLIKEREVCANNPKFLNNKNRQTNSLWMFNLNNVGIWSQRKQTYFIFVNL